MVATPHNRSDDNSRSFRRPVRAHFHDGRIRSSLQSAIIPAIVLLAGGPPLALSALQAAAWKASGRPLPAALAEGIGMLVTVVGLAVFAPRFGIIAAYTSVVAYGTVTCALFWLRTAPVVRVAPDVGKSEPYQGRADFDSNVLAPGGWKTGERLGYYPDPVGFSARARVTPWPASVRWEHRTTRPRLHQRFLPWGAGASNREWGSSGVLLSGGTVVRRRGVERVAPEADLARPLNSLPARKSGRGALKDSI